MYSDIQFYIYRILYDKIRYPHKGTIDNQMEEIVANVEDNVYVIKDGPWYKEQTILINGNIFYYKYKDFKKNEVGMDEHVEHFGEYEYKIEGENLYVRGLYIREDYTSSLCDGGSGDKVMIKVDGGWNVWNHRSARGQDTEKHTFKEEKTEGGWIEWESMYSPKAKEIIINHINGNKDLNSNYKNMLIPKAVVENIAKEYLRSLDNVELHFSQLYKSKSKDYDFFLFHRKNAFKFNEKYVVIVSKNEESINNEYVLKFDSIDLKNLFDKKKKKDGVEESDFIRIRINADNTASFELGNGELVDITDNIVKK